MEYLNVDLTVNIVGYCDVIDSMRFAATSKRMYYLVHEYSRIIGPQLVASRDNSDDDDDGDGKMVLEETSLPSVYVKTLRKLRTKPNLALAFNTSADKNLVQDLRTNLPSDAVVLGVEAPSIQANCEGTIDSDANAALMLGSFVPDRTQLLPFLSDDCNVQTVVNSLRDATPAGQQGPDANYWKVFIINVCGSGYYSAEPFVAGLQAEFPKAAIVGGICENGYVSSWEFPIPTNLEDMTLRQLQTQYNKLSTANKDSAAPTATAAAFDPTSASKDALVAEIRRICTDSKRRYVVRNVDDGIFGLAFGGDVPVRSIVSRGVNSVTGSGTVEGIPSRWYVDSTQYVQPTDDEYPFRGDPNLLHPIHFIETLRDAETGQSVGATSLFAKLGGRPEFVGIRRSGADGYELHPINPFSFQLDCFILMTDGSDEQAVGFDDANLDFFSLDASACNTHLEQTLSRLGEATKDEVLLGGIMFSCGGRGPSRNSMLGEKMADASRFKKQFPNVPCLGYYAGGEIGPVAMVGNKNVFMEGKAAVQGFTVVFALFIVPVVEPGSTGIDDSQDNIDAFLRRRGIVTE